jgi:hypothetical protein
MVCWPIGDTSLQDKKRTNKLHESCSYLERIWKRQENQEQACVLAQQELAHADYS